MKKEVEIKRVVLIAPIPFIGFKVGEIIEIEPGLSRIINFFDPKFFKPYFDPIYKVGEAVIYKGSVRYVKSRKESVSGFIYVLNDIPKLTSRFSETAKETELKPAKMFWFINSNGIVTPDYENRKGINHDGLKWKKQTGNYYKTKEEAVVTKNTINKKFIK